jgi:D-glycero-D-manno-heptose 1,7-bisphosphate phosphatase
MKITHIILDRDGTLIKYIPYLFEDEKVELINGTAEALKLLIEKKINLYLHTNQSGVGRGFFKMEHVTDCNKRMIELIGLGEGVFQETCIATDFPPSTITFRKPSNLFASQLIEKNKIKKESIIYIGDSISDLKTAKNAGCNAYGVMSGGFDLINLIKMEDNLNYKIFPNLLDVVKYLINKKYI